MSSSAAITTSLIFQDAEDYRAFLGWLRSAAKTYKVAIHAYVLLPNHLHLLVSPSDETGLGQMMQWIGRYYVPYFNQKYGRSGTLWQGRYKTSLIDADKYFMSCSRYIEFNPVRAGFSSRCGVVSVVQLRPSRGIAARQPDHRPCAILGAGQYAIPARGSLYRTGGASAHTGGNRGDQQGGAERAGRWDRTNSRPSCKTV